MKIVVFTAIIGNIDPLYPALPNAKGSAEFVCFTDKPRQESGIWEYDGLSEYPVIKSVGHRPITQKTWRQEIVEAEYGNRLTARYYKLLPHRSFPDADVSIWVDGNVRLRVSPKTLVKNHLPKGFDLASFAHPDRACLYEEAEFCAKKGKGKKSDILEQTRYYREQGMPPGFGLVETKCVIRRHTQQMADFNELWWEQLSEYSVRDQISLPYVGWETGVKMSVIPGRVAYPGWPGEHNKEFWMAKHVKKS
jgi:hypothetical protein